jgi:hypothetical protein
VPEPASSEPTVWLTLALTVGNGPVVNGKLDTTHLVSVQVTVFKLVVKTVAVTTEPNELVDFLVVLAGTFVVYIW